MTKFEFVRFRAICNRMGAENVQNLSDVEIERTLAGYRYGIELTKRLRDSGEITFAHVELTWRLIELAVRRYHHGLVLSEYHHMFLKLRD